MYPYMEDGGTTQMIQLMKVYLREVIAVSLTLSAHAN